MNEINLWTAIAEMRKLTAQGIPFSLEHYTWSSDRRKAGEENSGIKSLTVSKFVSTK